LHLLTNLAIFCNLNISHSGVVKDYTASKGRRSIIFGVVTRIRCGEIFYDRLL